METTAILLHRIAQGDARARNQLIDSLRPDLARYAHGRLPPCARGINTTQDIVSEALEKALNGIATFQLRREGAFLAYARTILRHVIVDRIRHAKARPQCQGIDEQLPSHDRSPLDKAMGAEFMARYEEALERLTPEQREAVFLRLELGYSHARIADAMGLSSPDAARMAVSRALERLADDLSEFDPHG